MVKSWNVVKQQGVLYTHQRLTGKGVQGNAVRCMGLVCRHWILHMRTRLVPTPARFSRQACVCDPASALLSLTLCDLYESHHTTQGNASDVVGSLSLHRPGQVVLLDHVSVKFTTRVDAEAGNQLRATHITSPDGTPLQPPPPDTLTSLLHPPPKREHVTAVGLNGSFRSFSLLPLVPPPKSQPLGHKSRSKAAVLTDEPWKALRPATTTGTTGSAAPRHTLRSYHGRDLQIAKRSAT
jgi:hypothetical protein